MGGTGKTPFTIHLARHYIAKGERVAILSLGYRGGIGYGTNVISDGKTIFHTPPIAADEPYMMATALPGAIVITGKDRTSSYNLAMQEYSPTIFLLDDGFQHRKMRRDVDIVLLDHKRPISTGFPAPFGYLREFPSALNRADIIVFTRATSTDIPKEALKYCKDKPVFFCQNEYTHFITDTGVLSLSDILDKRVFVISAIAKHDQFKEQLIALGANVVGERRYRDHHPYSTADVERVIKEAGSADYIVTTEKDIVKIPIEYRKRFIYPELSIKFLNDGIFEMIPK
jgi:tetraacyldisaccharide 4'-kinase